MVEADAWVARLPVPRGNAQETGETSVPLPADVLRAAYRLDTPCLCRHTTARNRLVNCVASPRCFAGFRDLATNTTVLNECVADIMGEGPALLPAEAGNPVVEDASNTLVCAKLLMPRRGIRNLGNTCYLNAILQLLFYIPSVRREVLYACAEAPAVVVPHSYEVSDDATHRTDKKEETETEEEGSWPMTHVLQASGLGELFAEMALTCDATGANAQHFAAFLSLDTQIQQDAQEFFALLLSWLQHEGGEAVTRNFEGTLLYDRRCGNCQRPFKRAEPFFFLSLPVKSSVEEALSTFLRSEEVEGFMCDGCNLTTTASSHQYLRTLPEVFVMHLNRFTFDTQTLRREKITRPVSFPLQWDLADYTNRWRQDQELQQQGSELSDSHITAIEACDAAHYELIGVVNHIGDTAVSGHYTFHGKVNATEGWYLFDDAEVAKLHHRFQGMRASSKEAYMLVYQRRPCEMTTADARANVTRLSDEVVGEEVPPVTLPLRLLKHVQCLNHELEVRRQAWEMRRAEVAAFLQQWGELARKLFGGGTGNTTTSATKKKTEGVPGSSDLAEFFALPSSWLYLLGRGFLPSYVDVRRHNDGEKRKKRLRNTPGSHLGLDDIMGGDIAKLSLLPKTELCEDADGAAFTAPMDDEATVRRSGGSVEMAMEGNLLFEDSPRALLLSHMEALRCPHGMLAPWSQYKLVPSALSAELASLLNTISSLSTASPSANEASSSSVGWRFSDYACEACTRAMGAEVLQLKQSWEEERAALALLSGTQVALNTSSGGNSMDTKSDPDVRREDDNQEESAVYVSKGVMEFWEDSRTAHAMWKEVVSRQGFTGLVVAASRMPTAAVDHSNDNDAPRPLLPECGILLCEHGLIAPSAAVQAVPAAVWRYLRERVVRPLCPGDDTIASLERLLPYLPVERAPRCPTCIQGTVSLTTQRHHARMSKIDEAKRFPTLAAAAQILSMTQAEMQEQHPNRLVWKRNLERLYRDHHRSWEKKQAAAIASLEAQVAALTQAEEAERRAAAAWEARCMRRGGHRRRAKDASSSTVTQGASQLAPSLPAAATPLQQAEEALTAARAAVCPDLCHNYGCIPMEWVVHWRRWFMDVDGVLAPPPRMHHEALRCPHGGTILPSHLLNPADPFWETKSVARHLVQILRQRSTATARNAACEVSSLDDDNLSLLPPLLLLPLAEFIDVLETYGESGMLLPPSSSGDKNTNDLLCRVNPGTTTLFVERNTDRDFAPPTCENCVAALLEEIKESSRCFFKGSLRLQLRLRRSRKNFYEASDVLRDLHHTTTLGELKQAISRLVAENHGFMLPLQEMELLRGRKPLRIQRPHTVERNGSNPQSSGAENAAAPLVIDANVTPASSQFDEDDGTLFDYGLRSGDALTVNATERVLAKFADTVQEPEVWEDVPAELLQPVRESATAFGATRLHGAVSVSQQRGGTAASVAAEAKAEVACDVCTFLNVAGRVRCEMCETPFKR
ncbi:putative ubiquitin hydrolase, putative,cysteine peptidase, Clan CA, family C19 [Trypanosoma rangeli]|uniref:ubiquitinyl hydrolase 1 n=1 Tax=Trypanosoma rangeli TaxID=5698 RepID=A0A422ND78_TRYRA|nr:putative ubiquitin hydrolase, putative,cysteine peptidase, Clan CA, family C19 [Trypanosoma rangeli]RNF03396.1 putative ubiquitin hydrolase, putative,cysteine peptidase, Clan CA, family C19 [Trypanosoma rangeli]|eukprot:RNF03396.1 putative ubiquitin hydrolase, putative,cysteine peptidase, Clan CA, family C19 [Trypanosoma rangeli]